MRNIRSFALPLSKSQHSEINSEAKTKVSYHICSKNVPF